MRQISLTLVMLVCVVALGAFFRFFELSSTPPGLYPDEAMNGVDALGALETGDFKVFYPDNNGREGLFINIQAIAIQVFGASPKTLRSVAAVFGTLTVLVLYFFTRELWLWRDEKEERKTARLFGVTWELPTTSELVALAAAFFIAVSLWHVNFSRIGFRAIMVPFLTTFGLALLLRGMRLRHRLEFIIAGAAFGLLLATYIGGRFAFLMLPLMFFADLCIHWRKKSKFREVLLPWCLCAAVMLFAALPMAGYFAAHPEDFFGRAGGVSVFAAENPFKSLGESLAKTLLMFHVRGDGNWRHNLAYSPQLNVLLGALLLLGIAWRFRQGLFERLRATRTAIPDVVLFSWLSLMLLPAILSSEGVPHALRTMGAIPPVLVLCAEGSWWLWERVRNRAGIHLALALGLTLLMLVGNVEFYRYFFVWASNHNVQGAFRQDLADIADVLQGLPQDSKRIVIVNESGVLLDGIPMPSATLRFLTLEDPRIKYLTPERVLEIEPLENTWIVLTQPAHQDLTTSLRALFPAIEKVSENPSLYRL